MARNFNKERQDINGERIVHEFLENNFYAKVLNYHECNNKSEQLKGVDTVFSFNDKEYKCDEKCALDYVNKRKGYYLNTFCLELSFLNRRDNVMEGWLTNESLETNSYLFVWLDKAKKDIIENIDDIEEVEIALVRKEDIFDYLNKIGWNRETLRIKDKRIREENDRSFGDMRRNGCKFSYAEYLPEKPINLLLTREIYKSLPNTYTEKIVIK